MMPHQKMDSVSGAVEHSHFQDLVRLTELRNEDRLSLGNAPVVGEELAVFPERVDLMQSEMILMIGGAPRQHRFLKFA